MAPKALGFSHLTTRQRHPAQDARTIDAFKKTSGHAEGLSGWRRAEKSRRDLVPDAMDLDLPETGGVRLQRSR